MSVPSEDARILLLARCEYWRVELQKAIDRHASRRALTMLIDQRVAAIQELAAVVGLVKTTDFDFFSTPHSAA